MCAMTVRLARTQFKFNILVSFCLLSHLCHFRSSPPHIAIFLNRELRLQRFVHFPCPSGGRGAKSYLMRPFDCIVRRGALRKRMRRIGRRLASAHACVLLSSIMVSWSHLATGRVGPRDRRDYVVWDLCVERHRPLGWNYPILL